MTDGDKKKSSLLPADNSSSRVSSGNDFILLLVPYGGLDGVLFDDRHMEETPEDYVNVTLLLFERLMLKTPHVRDIVKTFKLVFLWVWCT